MEGQMGERRTSGKPTCATAWGLLVAGFAILAVLALTAPVAWAAPTCADFLKITTLPRVAAMGEASVALSDATWAEANPANLTAIDGSLITISHTSWFQDISLQMLSVGTSSPHHGFGLSLVGLHTDALEEYDDEDVYLGQFRYYDFLLDATYARRLAPSLSAGASIKTLYEKIGWDSATGFAFDFGLAWSRDIAAARGTLSAGLAMHNLGTRMGYLDEKYDLPLAWQGGLAYRPAWLPSQISAALTADYRSTREGERGFLFGAEIGVAGMVALRVGGKSVDGVDRDGGNVAAGVGFSIKNLVIDYAYADFGENLGGTHRVSVGFKTNPIFPSPEEGS
jgi:hypothetical protein